MAGWEEVSEEEAETYTLVSTALKHPIRRRILRMLREKPLTFTEIQDPLEINSAHLSYHLNAMKELLNQTEDGRYFLSTFGNATVGLMRRVEENDDARAGITRYKMGFWFTALFLILLIVGVPVGISLVLIPVDFASGSYTINTLIVSDYTVTIENGSYYFPWSIGIDSVTENQLYTTKVEITTPWLSLDTLHIAGYPLGYYWMSGSIVDGFPSGEYLIIMYQQDEQSPDSMVIAYSRIMIEGTASDAKMFFYPGNNNTIAPKTSMPILTAFEKTGVLLTDTVKNQYAFKLVIYTNTTFELNEPPARFVLYYKRALFAGNPNVDPSTIGYVMLATPFIALLAKASIEWLRKKGLSNILKLVSNVGMVDS